MRLSASWASRPMPKRVERNMSPATTRSPSRWNQVAWRLLEALWRLARLLFSMHERDKLLGGRRCPRPQHNKRRDGFASARVRHADHGGRGHRGMLGEAVFDLAGKDVEPPRDDHVLQTIDHIQEAPVIPSRDIARAQPAVLEGLLGFLGAVPIAVHDQRSAHAYLARLANRRLATVLLDQLDLVWRQTEAAGFEQMRPQQIMVFAAEVCDDIRRFCLTIELAELGPNSL